MSRRQRHTALFAVVFLSIAAEGAWAQHGAFPADAWEQASSTDAGLDAEKLAQARDYALTCGGSGYVVRGGRLILKWGDVTRRHDVKSTTKGIGVTALGLAIKDDLMKLDDKAAALHPTFGAPSQENVETGWLDEITLFHLATQTAGFAKPGGYEKLQFEPGTMWLYSDGGPNWLAECVTYAYRRDVAELLFERVFTPLGITRNDLQWRSNQYRPKEIIGVPRREFGAGVHANADALARIGLLYLREGRWRDQQILPADFVATVRQTPKALIGLPEHPLTAGHGNASDHYGLLWWNNNDGALPDVPKDAFWCWGLYDSLVVVIPSLDLVVSRVSDNKSWPRREDEDHYAPLSPFLGPIAAAAGFGVAAADPMAKRQPRIRNITWAPPETIVRQAPGSDNWPLTWADDDAQYTAYGDGRGFQPFVERKLSIGLARIEGPPEDFRGINLRSPSIERTGDGAKGPKASGILMVEGTLYLWLRNVGNSQLAWSTDRGQSWTWSDWKFETSFGCPTFLNFGRNYQGARDEFVYVYSFDSDSAYEASDHTVLARVPKDQILDRSAYEFYCGADPDGQAQWSQDIRRRAPILSTDGRCYRTSVTRHPGLGVYLLVQLPGGDTRFRGGLSVWEAPEPWGPWHEVFHTDAWDVGPGESASFPAKWMDADGKGAWLVFSGEDAFSVRRATFDIDSRAATDRSASDNR